MATAQVSAKYAAKAQKVIDKLTEKGFVCSFGTETPGANTWDPPGAYVETGEAAVFPTEWKADFSTDVRSDDAFFIVAASVDVPACTHMVKPSGQTFEIIQTKPFEPDDVTVIYYEVQAR